tara:strand:- start:880 stop:1341 length:462 start_codon:yes stop_codon:yes gene_type:complete
MYRFRYLFLILLLHQSCEPDDVCNVENPSTPQLVFRLYDANQPSQLKSVDTLRVKDTENESILQLINTDSVAIPFQINSNKMDFDFMISEGVSDELLIDYQTQDMYLSRACGFQSTFIINEIEISSNQSWINTIEIVTNEILVDTLAHVKIYH